MRVFVSLCVSLSETSENVSKRTKYFISGVHTDGQVVGLIAVLAIDRCDVGPQTVRAHGAVGIQIKDVHWRAVQKGPRVRLHRRPAVV